MKTIYKLTRDLSGDRELIHLSTDREHLADLMRVDIDKWTVPVTYTIEITFEFDNLFKEGKTAAFKEAEAAIYKTSHGFPVRDAEAIMLRMAARAIEDLHS